MLLLTMFDDRIIRALIDADYIVFDDLGIKARYIRIITRLIGFDIRDLGIEERLVSFDITKTAYRRDEARSCHTRCRFDDFRCWCPLS